MFVSFQANRSGSKYQPKGEIIHEQRENSESSTTVDENGQGSARKHQGETILSLSVSDSCVKTILERFHLFSELIGEGPVSQLFLQRTLVGSYLRGPHG